MHHAQWRERRQLLVATAALAVLVLVLTTVRLASAAPSAAGSQNAAAGPQAASPRVRRRIAVRLQDFTIGIAHRRHLRAGRYTFHVTNRGPSSHNLTIRRRGARRVHATPTMSAGQTANLKVRLRRGRYTFYCSVPGHAALGMKVRVRVHRRA